MIVCERDFEKLRRKRSSIPINNEIFGSFELEVLEPAPHPTSSWSSISLRLLKILFEILKVQEDLYGMDWDITVEKISWGIIPEHKGRRWDRYHPLDKILCHSGLCVIRGGCFVRSRSGKYCSVVSRLLGDKSTRETDVGRRLRICRGDDAYEW